VAYEKCKSTEANLPPLDCSAAITNQLRQLLNSHSITCERVVGITSPRIAVSKADRIALADSGANVVDMESYEILAIAERASVPAAILRVVSDSVDRELPDFNQALNTQGSLDGIKALRVAVGSPFRTLRLLAANKRAIGELTKALRIVLPADWTSA
jgi:nucleoside phosphorylase